LATSTRHWNSPWISGFTIEFVSGSETKETTMDGLTRIAQQAEKPGRLQLAIVEWQRQLIAKREARMAETLIHCGMQARTGVTS
jgi:hypothetical protein